MVVLVVTLAFLCMFFPSLRWHARLRELLYAAKCSAVLPAYPHQLSMSLRKRQTHQLESCGYTYSGAILFGSIAPVIPHNL